MKELDTMKVGDFNVKEVLENKSLYLENPEVLAAVYDAISQMESKLYEEKKALTQYIIRAMTERNGTKLEYIGPNNFLKENKVITLQNGKFSCKKKLEDIERVIKKHNFDLKDFGEMEFKLLKWSEAKEKRKSGGNIQHVIDELFEQGEPTLKIGFKK